jgi:hypothetical protein
MNEVIVGVIGLGIVLLLFLTGIELAFAMIIMGFLGFGYLISYSAALNLLAKDIFDVLNSYGFTVIPLFVLMGQVAFNSGIATRLFDAAYKFIGQPWQGQQHSKPSAVLHLPQPQPSQAWQYQKWIGTIMTRDFLRASLQWLEHLACFFRQVLPLSYLVSLRISP